MAATQIKKVRYTTDAVIDVILTNPAVSQGELAEMFGYTQTWISIIINSDAFKNRLAERKGQLIDPQITASVEERLEALGKASLDRLLDRVNSSVPLKPLELVAMAKLGVGNRADKPVAPQQQNNLYVLSMPAPAASSKEWLSQARRHPGDTIEMEKTDRGFTPPVEILEAAAGRSGSLAVSEAERNDLYTIPAPMKKLATFPRKDA